MGAAWQVGAAAPRRQVGTAAQGEAARVSGLAQGVTVEEEGEKRGPQGSGPWLATPGRTGRLLGAGQQRQTAPRVTCDEAACSGAAAVAQRRSRMSRCRQTLRGPGRGQGRCLTRPRLSFAAGAEGWRRVASHAAAAGAVAPSAQPNEGCTCVRDTFADRRQ